MYTLVHIFYWATFTCGWCSSHCITLSRKAVKPLPVPPRLCLGKKLVGNSDDVTSWWMWRLYLMLSTAVLGLVLCLM